MQKSSDDKIFGCMSGGKKNRETTLIVKIFMIDSLNHENMDPLSKDFYYYIKSRLLLVYLQAVISLLTD